MLLSFENSEVNTEDILNLLLFPQVKIIAFFFVFASVMYFLSRKNKEPSSKIFNLAVDEFICLFKAFAYGFLAFCVFFYNFETKQFAFEVKKQMLLSTIFVGILAIYETISNIYETIKNAQNYLSTRSK